MRVGLALTDADEEPFRSELDIRYLECHQFRAAKSAGEAEQQDRSISPACQAIRDMRQHGTETFNRCRYFLLRWGSERPANPLQGRFHLLGTGWAIEPRASMRKP